LNTANTQASASATDSDGTFSTELIDGKEPIAVVYWVGDPTAKDSALLAEHPECTHGLAVTLTDAANGENMMWQPEFTAFRQTVTEYSGIVGRWVKDNTTYKSSVTQNNTESLMRAIGYNYTKGFEAFNEAMPDYIIQAVAEVTAYGEQVAAPEKSSGWYLPSIIELRDLLCTESDEIRENGMYGMNNTNTINAVLEKIESAELIDGNYWSSSEHNQYTKAWSVSLTLQGRVWSQNKNYALKVRPIIAF